VTSPTYKVAANRPAIGYLDVSVTHNKAKNELYVNVLNRSEKLDIAAKIDNQTGSLAASADVWEMNHADLKAVHTFIDDKRVRPTMKKAAVTGNTIAYTFPKHSLTILRVGVR
jgi:alpha-L-arabinofuranosidase